MFLSKDTGEFLSKDTNEDFQMTTEPGSAYLAKPYPLFVA